MITQESAEADFKDWLQAVQAVLEMRIFMDLPGTRIQKLTAYILLRSPAKTVAQELVNGLPDSLIGELSNRTLESLVDELAQELNNYLLSRLARTMTDWLEKKLKEEDPNGSLRYPGRAPEETAEYLLKIMADETWGDNIFCPPATRPGKRGRSVCGGQQDLQCRTAPFRPLFSRPGYLALVMRAHAVRFRVAGMAAVMLFTRVRQGKILDESLFS